MDREVYVGDVEEEYRRRAARSRRSAAWWLTREVLMGVAVWPRHRLSGADPLPPLASLGLALAALAGAMVLLNLPEVKGAVLLASEDWRFVAAAALNLLAVAGTGALHRALGGGYRGLAVLLAILLGWCAASVWNATGGVSMAWSTAVALALLVGWEACPASGSVPPLEAGARSR